MVKESGFSENEQPETTVELVFISNGEVVTGNNGGVGENESSSSRHGIAIVQHPLATFKLAKEKLGVLRNSLRL